jgi:hypothetical protein
LRFTSFEESVFLFWEDDLSWLSTAKFLGFENIPEIKDVTPLEDVSALIFAPDVCENLSDVTCLRNVRELHFYGCHNIGIYISEVEGKENTEQLLLIDMSNENLSELKCVEIHKVFISLAFFIIGGVI